LSLGKALLEKRSTRTMSEPYIIVHRTPGGAKKRLPGAPAKERGLCLKALYKTRANRKD
jgi:hypothetical protein